jgi:hypothetical protein
MQAKIFNRATAKRFQSHLKSIETGPQDFPLFAAEFLAIFSIMALRRRRREGR